jgi:hypothetical protein
MVREAVSRANQPDHTGTMSYGDLGDVLYDIAGERGEINRRKLGRWITRHAGRIVNGLKFTRASGSRSAEAWKVEKAA